jgi:hypothetical protein
MTCTRRQRRGEQWRQRGEKAEAIGGTSHLARHGHGAAVSGVPTGGLGRGSGRLRTEAVGMRTRQRPSQPIRAQRPATEWLTGGSHSSALFHFKKFSKIYFCTREIDTK